MRFVVGFILVLVGSIFVQSVPVVRQVDGNSLAALLGTNDGFDSSFSEINALLPPDQFKLFEKELMQLLISEYSENMDLEQLDLKFQNLLQKYLDKNAGNFLRKRQLTPIDSLDDIQGLNSEFDEILAEIANFLPADQYELFKQEFLEIILSSANEDIDPDAIELKILNFLEKYFGSDFESRLDLQYVARKLVKSAGVALSNLVKGVNGF